MEVAVTVPVPAAVGVNTTAFAPDVAGVPPAAFQVTEELNGPVPSTVAVQVVVWVVRIDAGEQTTETDVMVEGAVTVTMALPDLVESCTDVAVTVAEPVVVGVNTAVFVPEEAVVPSVAVQVTAGLYAPVPCTVAAQLDVCVVKMDVGEQFTETDVTVGGTAVTVTVALPDLLES